MQQQLQTRRPTATPAAIRYAITAMYIGLACSLITAVAAFADQEAFGGIADALKREYPKYTAEETASEESAVVTYLYVLSALGVACWLWMLRSTRRAWRGTRVTASVIFTLALCVASINVYVPMPGLLGLTVWLPCVAGAVAVYLLWKKEAGAHFAASAVVVPTPAGEDQTQHGS